MCLCTCASLLTHEHAHFEKCTQVIDMCKHIVHIWKFSKGEITNIAEKFSNKSAHYFITFIFICIIWLYSLTRPHLRLWHLTKEMLKIQMCTLWVWFSWVSKYWLIFVLSGMSQNLFVNENLKPNCTSILNWTQMRGRLSQLWACVFSNPHISRCRWESQS